MKIVNLMGSFLILIIKLLGLNGLTRSGANRKNIKRGHFSKLIDDCGDYAISVNYYFEDKDAMLKDSEVVPNLQTICLSTEKDKKVYFYFSEILTDDFMKINNLYEKLCFGEKGEPDEEICTLKTFEIKRGRDLSNDKSLKSYLVVNLGKVLEKNKTFEKGYYFKDAYIKSDFDHYLILHDTSKNKLFKFGKLKNKYNKEEDFKNFCRSLDIKVEETDKKLGELKLKAKIK